MGKRSIAEFGCVQSGCSFLIAHMLGCLLDILMVGRTVSGLLSRHGGVSRRGEAAVSIELFICTRVVRTSTRDLGRDGRKQDQTASGGKGAYVVVYPQGKYRAVEMPNGRALGRLP